MNNDSKRVYDTSSVLSVLMVITLTVILGCSSGDDDQGPATPGSPGSSVTLPPPLAAPTTPSPETPSGPPLGTAPAPPPAMAPAPPPVVQPTVSLIGRGSRLNAVRQRGHVICAGRDDVPGFGFVDETGRPVGFDIDLCRAVATAVLGNPEAIVVRVIATPDRGPVLQSGEVDLLVRQATWTTLRDAEWGDFAPTMIYDGQGFIVRRRPLLDIPSSILQLDNVSVCVTAGTTTEANLLDFARTNSLNISPIAFPDFPAVVDAYLSNRCAAFTADRSGLASARSTFANINDHILLPETISEEPLSPVAPHGDSLWFDIVKAVMSMLIYAEAYGVTSATVPTSPTGDVKVDRLFGLNMSSYGLDSLGLSPTAAQDVIRAIGNYGELYNRHLGPSGTDLPRENSRNALWDAAPCTQCPKGGQVYAAPPQ